MNDDGVNEEATADLIDGLISMRHDVPAWQGLLGFNETFPHVLPGNNWIKLQQHSQSDFLSLY